MSEQPSSFEGRHLFQGSDTSFGFFYPTDHFIAIFDSYETARRAQQTLLSAGYSEDGMEAVPSESVIADIEKGTRDVGLLTRIKQHISKAVGSEARYWEEDLRQARQGAGFLTVYCPKEHEAQRIVELLEPEQPRDMRRYLKLAIEEYV